MQEKYISEYYERALKFIAKRKGYFNSVELAYAVKCAPRTARAYCRLLTKLGLVERKNTHPLLTYIAVEKPAKRKTKS